MSPDARAAAPGLAGRHLAALRELRQAEDFFAFFDLPYEPRVVHVYRLHVLKRFALEMETIDRAHPMIGEPERLALYREALRRSHDVFARSTAQDEKLFKVFQGGSLVSLNRRSP